MLWRKIILSLVPVVVSVVAEKVLKEIVNKKS